MVQRCWNVKRWQPGPSGRDKQIPRKPRDSRKPRNPRNLEILEILENLENLENLEILEIQETPEKTANKKINKKPQASQYFPYDETYQPSSAADSRHRQHHLCANPCRLLQQCQGKERRGPKDRPLWHHCQPYAAQLQPIMGRLQGNRYAPRRQSVGYVLQHYQLQFRQPQEQLQQRRRHVQSRALLPQKLVQRWLSDVHRPVSPRPHRRLCQWPPQQLPLRRGEQPHLDLGWRFLQIGPLLHARL